jgi:hypothetical protein
VTRSGQPQTGDGPLVTDSLDVAHAFGGVSCCITPDHGLVFMDYLLLL